MELFSEKTVVVKEIAGVRCNKCGRTLAQDDFGHFEDYLAVKKAWGYHSPVDGETHAFDVCFGCYREWVKQFTIPPQAMECQR